MKVTLAANKLNSLLKVATITTHNTLDATDSFLTFIKNGMVCFTYHQPLTFFLV